MNATLTLRPLTHRPGPAAVPTRPAAPRVLRAAALTVFLGAAAALAAPPLRAQLPATIPGSLDPGFNAGAGFDDAVDAVLVQPNGHVVAAGAFSRVDGQPHHGIARLYPNGSPEPGFASGRGFNGQVRALLRQQDGRIVAGGDFTRYDGVPRGRIARLNVDGSLDLSFDPGAGFDATVSALAIEPGGRIVVGGSFFTCDGVSRGRIARLNVDGGLDPGFNPGLGFDGFGVEALVRQPDTRFLAAGSFTTFDGVPRAAIARLNVDGSLDTSFDPGTGFAGVSSAPVANVIVLQSDRQILVGGQFAGYDGSAQPSLVRLHVNGSLDPALKLVTGTLAVGSLLVQPTNGRIVVGEAALPRLTVGGTVDPRFNPGTGFVSVTGGTTARVSVLALQADGRIIAGGLFSSFNGVARNNLARIYGDGTVAVPAAPTVTIRAVVPVAFRFGAVPGALEVRRAVRDDLTASVTVAYAVGGSAVGGTDYQTLSGQVTIPAGQRGAAVSVQPLAGTGAPKKATVSLTLQPVPGGDPSPAKVYLLGKKTMAKVVIRQAEVP